MNGILIVDKPAGWTSHDVVNFTRKRFSIKKAGHAGTLDPMATGVLVLLLGDYTKFSSELSGQDKEYKTVLTLGTVTDTGDRTGNVIKTQTVPLLDIPSVKQVLEGFVGDTEQVPPMISALNYQGQRLYKLARSGKEVPRAPRKVIISNLILESFRCPDVWLHVVCSKGTYIRTLCEDIGNKLGCGGHMSYLRRIRSGSFSIEQAVNIERLKQISIEELETHILRASP